MHTPTGKLKLTLDEVARLAGVSRTTASRVVNGHPEVRDLTRQRVLEIIAQTGYQPHAAARSLAFRYSQVIGLVIPMSVQFLFTDPYFPYLIQGISQACNTHHYTLSLFLFHSTDEEREIYPRVLGGGLVDGLIIGSTQIDDPLIPQLVENKVPFVLIGRPYNRPDVTFINVENVQGSHAAASHLIRLGYERLATITGPRNTTTGQDRLEGFMQAMQERGRRIDPNLIVEGDFTEAGGYAAMRQLLLHQPNAVFAASDMMAMGALRAIREAGLIVPDDVALVGYDDLPASSLTTPPLTTIRQPIRQLGIQAVFMLLDLIQNGLEPPRRLILSSELVIRGSCGAITAPRVSIKRLHARKQKAKQALLSAKD